MDDALLVRGFERVGDLLRDRQHVGERQRTAPDDRGEVLTIDELHHERVLLDAVDRADVRMVERGEQLRLAREPSQAAGVSRKELGQDLQRNVAIESGVAGAIDLAHAAFA